MALLEMHPAEWPRSPCAQPYLSDAQLSVMIDRCERQVRRYLKKFKAADLDDALSRLRQQSYMEAELND